MLSIKFIATTLCSQNAALHFPAFRYPLAFVGCRDGILEMLQVPKEERTDAKLNTLTYAILGFVTVAALTISDLSFIMSFGGATLGNALIYVYPAIMFRSAGEMVFLDDIIGNLTHDKRNLC